MQLERDVLWTEVESIVGTKRGASKWHANLLPLINAMMAMTGQGLLTWNCKTTNFQLDTCRNKNYNINSIAMRNGATVKFLVWITQFSKWGKIK